MHALDLDRMTPREPPPGRAPAGYQGWRELLFAHWTYALADVRAVVPAELELDPWDGLAWVGVVPFVMRDIRLAWMLKGLGLNFLETNLRTYVHYRGEPGVYFFSLEASSWLAVQAARRGWGLPYHHAAMRTTTAGRSVEYASTRKKDPAATLQTTYEIGDDLGVAAPGTLDFFLLERYYMFAVRSGVVLKGHVHHRPYPIRRARVEGLQCGLLAAAGLPARTEAPAVVHASPGVDVTVYGPWPV